MTRLTQRDAHLLLDAVHRIYHSTPLESFPAQALAVLAHVVPVDAIGYTEVNLRRRRAVGLIDPPAVRFPEDEPIWARYMRQHPVLRYMERSRDGSARAISDFLTQPQFHRLELYNEFYRRMRIEQQLAFTLDTPEPLMIALALNRARRAFSERERLLLNLLRPHLIQASHNAAALTQLHHEAALRGATLEGLDRGVIALTQKGSVLLMTARARRWVEQYCGALPRHAARLPQSLWQWVAQQQRTASIESGEISSPYAPLVLQQEGNRLVVRLFRGLGAGQFLLLLEEQTELQPVALAPLGLTKRESEILYWVMRGKTNVQIGDVLGISALTVRLRLEHIFQKLGVASRLAATVHALERLGLVKI